MQDSVVRPANQQSGQRCEATAEVQVVDTLIIGTGFSGLLAAIGLQKQNLGNFVLLERSAEPGGTWRDNAYPGAEVDIPTIGIGASAGCDRHRDGWIRRGRDGRKVVSPGSRLGDLAFGPRAFHIPGIK